MATAKGNEITNLEASGSIQNPGLLVADVKVAIGTIAAGTGDIDDNDVILLCAVPSHAKIHKIEMVNDDLDSGSALAVDVGLYNGDQAFKDGSTEYAPGAVIDRDCFATASAELQSANTAWVDLRFEAADITTLATEAHAIGGLSSDPAVNLYVGLTIETAAGGAQAGDIALRVTYSDK